MSPPAGDAAAVGSAGLGPLWVPSLLTGPLAPLPGSEIPLISLLLPNWLTAPTVAVITATALHRQRAMYRLEITQLAPPNS